MSDCHEAACVNPIVEIRLGEMQDNARDHRMLHVDAEGTVVGVSETERIEDEAAYPNWYTFAMDVRQMEQASEQPEPVLDSYQGLPAPSDEESITTAAGAIAGVLLAGVIARSRMTA